MKISKHIIFSVAMLASLVSAHAEVGPSPWERRQNQEAEWRRQGLVLVPYKLNYLMPWSYNTSPHATSRHSAEHREAKFQVSVKVLLADQLFQQDAHLYFGYTQLSLWQLYDRDRSAPFRDTNYEPEAILSFDNRRSIGGAILRKTEIGLVHQSNGVSDPDSRSWNRLYTRLQIDRDNLALSVRPWIRVPEKTSHDDNKHIERYMGYGDIELSYFLENHVVTILLRNNLRFDGNKGAVELNYSFPMTRILTGLVQYFNGYGETLIDFNHPTNRVSVGIALSNWR